jgi:hypothetical protein
MPENSSKKSGAGVVLLVLFVIGLLIALILFLRYRAKKKIANQTIPENQNETLNINPTSPDEFFNIVHSIVHDEQTAKILTAQAMHETGMFKDNKYTVGCNAFGMKYPEKRETFATGQAPNGYAIFDSVDDSVKDLIMWLEYNGLPVEYITTDEFAQQIRDKGYYTAPFVTYASALRKHYKKLE